MALHQLLNQQQESFHLLFLVEYVSVILVHL